MLRNKVLHKDERWLTLHAKASGNRDERLAEQIVAELNKRGTEFTGTRIPMFAAWKQQDYPVAAAPPIKSIADKELDKAQKGDEK